MSEPEVALAFTPDRWVEELHRYLSDHGGARVRSVLVEPGVALEESYDVLVAGHRWPALTRALVGDVRSRGRAVLGVFDREEPESRRHLLALGVDDVVESDRAFDAIVRAIVSVARTREDRAAPVVPAMRTGRIVAVGGPPGTGRTEIAIQLTVALARAARVALVDADDVAPSIAARLALDIEPNLRTAIDAAEHGRGDVSMCVARGRSFTASVMAGLPNAGAWAQVRPGEVIRVVEHFADAYEFVVVDGAGSLEVVAASSRGRFATARALVAEADMIVAVCDAAPHGVTRVLSWLVEARSLAPETAIVVVANRAANSKFQRGELVSEFRECLPSVRVVCAPFDARVADAAWAGAEVARGAFTRAVDELANEVTS